VLARRCVYQMPTASTLKTFVCPQLSLGEMTHTGNTAPTDISLQRKRKSIKRGTKRRGGRKRRRRRKRQNHPSFFTLYFLSFFFLYLSSFKAFVKWRRRHFSNEARARAVFHYAFFLSSLFYHLKNSHHWNSLKNANLLRPFGYLSPTS